MTVAVIGTVAFDSIETPRGNHDRILGGSGTYASVAASLFAPVHLISIVGQDFPDSHIAFLEARGIRTNGITRAQGQTFHWKGYYTADMNQAHTVQTDLNVLLEFDPLVPPKAQTADIVFLGNIDPALQRRALAQFVDPKLVVLDSMNYWIQDHLASLKETLKHVDLLILNDQEIRLLTGIDNVVQAIPVVQAMGPGRVIVKKGEHGALMAGPKGLVSFPALPLRDLVDPTGAGDSFAGAIVGVLATSDLQDESSYVKALITGILVASATVQAFSLGRLEQLDQGAISTLFSSYKAHIPIPDTI